MHILENVMLKRGTGQCGAHSGYLGLYTGSGKAAQSLGNSNLRMPAERTELQKNPGKEAGSERSCKTV